MAMLLAISIFCSFSYGQSLEEADLKSLFSQYHLTFLSGESRWKAGDFLGAFAQLKTARQLAQRMKDAEKEIQCLMLLGKLCWAIGQPEDSEKIYSDALIGARNIGLKRTAEESQLALRIWKLYSQGRVDLFAGQYEDSIKHFDSAIELARNLGSKEHEIKCLRQLCGAYWAKQDLGAFLSINEKSLKIAQEINDQIEQINSLINIGSYYLKLSDYSRALNYYSDAMDISRNTNNKKYESFCLKNISLILAQLGFHERSLDYLTAAYNLDRQVGSLLFLSQDVNNLGEAFRNKGLIFSNKADLYEAMYYFKEALDLAKRNKDKKTELKALNNIGNICLNLENYQAAEKYFQSTFQIAEELQDSEALIEILNNIGICNLKIGNEEKSQRCFKEALKRGGQINTSKILWESLFYLGQCYEKKEAYNQALACYKNSIDAIEFLRSQIKFDYYKVGFAKNKFKVYESAIDLLCRLNKDDVSATRAEEIFNIVERAKARAFLETLGELKSSFRDELNPALEKKKDEISDEISAVIQEMSKGDLPPGRLVELQLTLKRFEDEYIGLSARIRADVPDAADAISPVAIQLKQVQECLLDEKTAILEYFLGEKNSLLFFITKNRFSIFPLPPRNEVERSIYGYVNLLSDPPKGKWKGALAAKRLSQDLLFPVTKILSESIERLILIPDGLLLYLPFETLTLARRDPSSGEDFLISRYAISYACSCSSLLFLKERRKKDQFLKGLLAFGNPLYPSNNGSTGIRKITISNIMRETYEDQGFDFSSLTQSDREIKEISGFFSRSNRTICLKNEASQEMIKKMPLEDYQIIHFACHGFIDEKIPYRSGLILSFDESSGEAGFLQVRGIANLRLNAELVVLSACETGRGYIEKGEGILGLTRSFFCSGARSVVSSLWKVADKSTAKFMGYFYYYLSQKKDKVQALRLAKLRMLQSEYSHPFYWAAFILNGEPSSTLNIY